MKQNVDEQFVITLTDTCKSHDAWLSVVNFGMAELLRNQPLLMEVITQEAVRQTKSSAVPNTSVSDNTRAIFQELGLRFEATA